MHARYRRTKAVPNHPCPVICLGGAYATDSELAQTLRGSVTRN